ncbi:MAG: 16S rRNA (cytidine(1402)-2'-O)-methyltransferase [Peptostreptococcaceae bacterium]|nr:16S rRNA (cytidine(1402)-2'-O)-methyltransferase [Peptostreptococcaceae bacterium]
MLYICATPIGNLEDITIRTLNVLKSVDYILCEDTRRTLKLLNHYDIKKKLVSMNEHTEFKKKERILDDLKNGMDIALVSDAGMPGIQDPGQLLIRSLIEDQLPYTVLPGPSAMITALVGSGLSQDEFLFLGFLPRKMNERIQILNKYKDFVGEVILYEAPHRFSKLLEDILSIWGDRTIVIAREISKKFEEYDHTTVNEALRRQEIKGELVLIIKRPDIPKDLTSEQDLQLLIKQLLDQGIRTKEIAKKIAELSGISKNQAYDLVVGSIDKQ